MDISGPEIQQETCNEYEFENYSLVHNLTAGKWELHFYDDEEGELFTCIEDFSFEEESELFARLGFTKEVFCRILSFEEKNYVSDK
jgi:hypothetical protein